MNTYNLNESFADQEVLTPQSFAVRSIKNPERTIRQLEGLRTTREPDPARGQNVIRA